MARTPLVVTTLEGAYGDYGAGEADITMAAADIAVQNDFTLNEGDIVFAHNTSGGALTVTINSVADEKGRTGDITTYSVGAGEYAAFGPFTRPGWVQTTGKLHLEASGVAVKLGVLRQR